LSIEILFSIIFGGGKVGVLFNCNISVVRVSSRLTSTKVCLVLEVLRSSTTGVSLVVVTVLVTVVPNPEKPPNWDSARMGAPSSQGVDGHRISCGHGGGSGTDHEVFPGVEVAGMQSECACSWRHCNVIVIKINKYVFV
jgi:hypothetical protein